MRNFTNPVYASPLCIDHPLSGFRKNVFSHLRSRQNGAPEWLMRISDSGAEQLSILRLKRDEAGAAHARVGVVQAELVSAAHLTGVRHVLL